MRKESMHWFQKFVHEYLWAECGYMWLLYCNQGNHCFLSFPMRILNRRNINNYCLSNTKIVAKIYWRGKDREKEQRAAIASTNACEGED